MNINEQRVREFAYQIWESEGRPFGHSERHWEMANKLAHADDEAHLEYAHADTDIPANEPVEPISPGQPQEQPVSDPIQPGEPPQQPAQPKATAKKARSKAAPNITDEIPDTITAVAPPRKSRTKAAADAPAKSLIDTQPISMGMPADQATTPAATKKPTKPRKTKAPENASA